MSCIAAYIIVPTTVTRGRYSIIFYYTPDIIKYIHKYIIQCIIYDVSFYYARRGEGAACAYNVNRGSFEMSSYYTIYELCVFAANRPSTALPRGKLQHLSY
jgi:hypothetical protein